MGAFGTLRQRLKVHIAYARVFDDVLTAQELIERSAPDDPDAVERELAALESDHLIERMGELCFLPGCADPDRARVVAGRDRRTQQILDDNAALLQFVARLPWVRLLAISGSLARSNAVEVEGKRADLDLFIVTEPASVHVVRFLVRLVTLYRYWTRRVGTGRARARPCLNYVTERDFLEVTNRSFYTASDAVLVRVLKGRGEYRRFLDANPWIGRYYPGVRTSGVPPIRRTRHPIRGLVNLACFCALASAHGIKARLGGNPYLYALGVRADRAHSLRRTAPALGGHERAVARRFREVYRRYYEHDEELESFLFPPTLPSASDPATTHARSETFSNFAYRD